MSNKMITTAITAVLSLGIAQTSTAVFAADNLNVQAATSMDKMLDLKDMEKCYGISRAGQNECGTDNHSCAGEEKVDGSKTAWILVPKGLCNRIVGGSLTAKEKA